MLEQNQLMVIHSFIRWKHTLLHEHTLLHDLSVNYPYTLRLEKDTPLYHAINFGHADGIYGRITERQLGKYPSSKSITVTLALPAYTSSCHNPCNTLAHYSSCLVHYQGIRRSAMVDCLMKHGAKPLLNLDPTKLFRLCAGQGVLPLVQQAIEMKQVNPIPN